MSFNATSDEDDSFRGLLLQTSTQVAKFDSGVVPPPPASSEVMADLLLTDDEDLCPSPTMVIATTLSDGDTTTASTIGSNSSSSNGASNGSGDYRQGFEVQMRDTLKTSSQANEDMMVALSALCELGQISSGGGGGGAVDGAVDGPEDGGGGAGGQSDLPEAPTVSTNDSQDSQQSSDGYATVSYTYMFKFSELSSRTLAIVTRSLYRFKQFSETLTSKGMKLASFGTTASD